MVRALAADPILPGVVWAATSGGVVYRSADAGETWSPVVENLFASEVRDLVVAGTTPRRLYVATVSDVFRSDDEGATWRRTGFPSFTIVWALLIDSDNPDRLWAGTHRGVWVTEDGGGAWRSTGVLDLLDAWSVAGGPGAGGRLFAGTQDGLWWSDDEGESWRRAIGGLPSGLGVWNVEVDPVTPTTVYVSSLSFFRGSSIVYRSTDRGVTWQKASTGLPENVPSWSGWRLVADPGAAGTLFAGLETRIYGNERADVGIYRTTNGGATWESVASPADRSIYDLLVSSGAVLAGFEAEGDFFGVLRSPDNGSSWTASLSGFVSSGIEGLVANETAEGRLVVSTTRRGVQGSLDRGASWHTADLDPDKPFTGPLARDPNDPTRLWVATGEEPGAYSRVLRSLDGGQTWDHLADIEGRTTSLEVDPSTGDILYAAGADGIWRSEDGGRSWEKVAFAPEEFFEPIVLEVAAGPRTPGLVLAGSRLEDQPIDPPLSGPQVWRSLDYGRTWDRVFSRTSGTSNPTRFSFAFSPRDPSTILAGYSAFRGGKRLLRSTDFGASWQEIEFPHGEIRTLAYDPLVPGLAFVGTRNRGVHVGFPEHGDDALWQRVGRGLDGADVQHLVRDPFQPSVLYAGTAGAGLFRLAPRECASPGGVCLGGRFRLTASFTGLDGEPKTAGSQPFTESSGLFWFSRPENPELLVKVLDGTSVNGHFWLFYGALSNRAYTLEVVDTLLGTTRTYTNPQGTMASVGDTLALPEPIPPPEAHLSRDPLAASLDERGETAALLADRFQVEVAWADGRGRTGVGSALPVSPESVAFWFFNPENPELLVKVLDGRVVNGRFWVFFGSLTNVGFTLTVTDTATGAVRTYENAQGTFGSRADTTAF